MKSSGNRSGMNLRDMGKPVQDAAPTAQPTFLNTSDMVRRYNNTVSAQTLANWRSCRTGPKFVKVGARVFYDLRDVQKWEQNRTVQTAPQDQ